MTMTPPLLPTTALLLSSPAALAFAPSCNHRRPLHRRRARTATRLRSSYAPSTVTDPDGPCPLPEADPIPEVDLDSLPESNYDEDNYPVPGQPWRRGDTDGCHDPISAPWRREAESLIADAARSVGGRVVDVTWYMAQCVISLDEDSFANVVRYTDGPEVQVVYPDETDAPPSVYDIFRDHDAGTEDEHFDEEDEILGYEAFDEDTEYAIINASIPVEYHEKTGEELPRRQPRDRTDRARDLADAREEFYRHRGRDMPVNTTFGHPVDTKALSVISQAIMRALEDEDVEEQLAIVSRHDIVLASPLDTPWVLDSQRDFDNARDLDVYVETRDPWGSNRVLKGKLVDRNALDVIINQENSGRMVTIPQNMIYQVLLPSGLAAESEQLLETMEFVEKLKAMNQTYYEAGEDLSEEEDVEEEELEDNY